MSRRKPIAVQLTCWSAAIAMSAAAFPLQADSGPNGAVRARVCTSIGVRFVTIDARGQQAPSPEKDPAACHGPCLTMRWKTPLPRKL